MATKKEDKVPFNSCEQYVIHELLETKNENEELKEQVTSLRRSLDNVLKQFKEIKDALERQLCEMPSPEKLEKTDTWSMSLSFYLSEWDRSRAEEGNKREVQNLKDFWTLYNYARKAKDEDEDEEKEKE